MLTKSERKLKKFRGYNDRNLETMTTKIRSPFQINKHIIIVNSSFHKFPDGNKLRNEAENVHSG